jgi:hypothetical protein
MKNNKSSWLPTFMDRKINYFSYLESRLLEETHWLLDWVMCCVCSVTVLSQGGSQGVQPFHRCVIYFLSSGQEDMPHICSFSSYLVLPPGVTVFMAESPHQKTVGAYSLQDPEVIQECGWQRSQCSRELWC